jgi:hypothetical protein
VDKLWTTAHLPEAFSMTAARMWANLPGVLGIAVKIWLQSRISNGATCLWVNAVAAAGNDIGVKQFETVIIK